MDFFDVFLKKTNVWNGYNNGSKLILYGRFLADPINSSHEQPPFFELPSGKLAQLWVNQL
jgi:hypothetical protein